MLGPGQTPVQTIGWIHKIHGMDIRSVDLNLLVIFDAMCRHRSVNKAAEAVGLSQPATSAALARLRTLLDDALFVRTGGRMEPTPRAVELAASVHKVMDIVNADILKKTRFDPLHAQRSFTLITPDIGEVAFLPGVLRRLRLEAPQVQLKALAMPRKVAAEALENGEADLAVGFFPDLQKAGFFQQGLFRTSYTCIACAANQAMPDRVTLKQYLAARHIVVRPDGREHMFDRFMEAKGWLRHVTLELSHFMSLLALLPGSDLIATVPDDIATVLTRHVRVKTVQLPFNPPQIHVQQFWHRRVQEDAANRWLREMVYTVNRRGKGEQLPL